MGSLVVVVVDPDCGRGESLFEARELVGPDAFLLVGADAFDERVAVGVAVRGAAELDAQHGRGVEIAAGGELGAVEFLMVVKGVGGIHAGVGTSGVSERSATPFLTRSSRRVALTTLEIERRAARTSAGIW
jgi:hypothetical protein